MKLVEMRDLTLDEIPAKLEDLRRRLFEARFQKATHQLDDTALFGRLKKEIAQLKTIEQEKKRARQGDKVHA